jgi:hypothetical protein
VRILYADGAGRGVNEPTLFPLPPADGNLTERQSFALDKLRAQLPDGLTADELGALLCERRGKHDAGIRCTWCASAGREVLSALRDRGLVRRRRGGLWLSLAQGAEKPPKHDPRTAPIPY